MPFNPKAVQIKIDRNNGERHISLLSIAAAVGLRDRITIRPEGRIFNQPNDFTRHVEYICDDLPCNGNSSATTLPASNPEVIPGQLQSSPVAFYQQQRSGHETMEIQSAASGQVEAI
ncbi:unnamed protein product [Allacma fusca]|uniref:Uncharacterized protein n=1 Tax=Allacma fusca TaxID=39272 RepID=A0A8J2KSU0_9HEXA|nr:unnamed protein product [Allacma fusca]